ncbi:hypothetical protein AK830_g7808 [Neonectria ditissima]|uniref:MOSC domain-containing protein n=1 Tax=Neonectria ditissima TaxID=78410 RepID=A0A0P7BFG6_9HYPO|nr:hypothetical protein AK830_g7808 [Neonectria ditissima]
MLREPFTPSTGALHHDAELPRSMAFDYACGCENTISLRMPQPGAGLQSQLADVVHGSALVQGLGDLTTSLPEFLDQLDAVSLVLLVVTLVAFTVPIFILFPPIPVERSDALRQTHSRVGLPPKRTNLRDQLSPVHRAQSGRPPKVQSLHVYPIKSCRGIELARSKVLPSGLEHDRLYTFAQLRTPAPGAGAGPASSSGHQQPKPAWEFLTQRQLPLLANVKVDLWVPDAAKTSRQLGVVNDAFLVVRFPWMDRGPRGLAQWVTAKMSRGLRAEPEKEFMLPISFPDKQEIKARGYTFADVKIWKDVTFALNVGTEVPPELTQYLGVKHRLGLFRMDPSKQREVFRCAQPESVLGYQPAIDFQDGYPLHLLSLTSMQDLDTLLLKDETMKGLDARRFRANIIISGAEKYEEETWKTINLKHPSTNDECGFDVACRTVRCKLPNVDPSTGIRHKVEPDRALRKFRDVDEGAPKMGCLGMQLCPMFPPVSTAKELESYIEVGMRIDVLKHGSHRYVKS